MSTLLSLGLVSVTTGLVLWAVSAAIGVVLYARVDSYAVETAPSPVTARADVRGATA